MAPLPRLLRCGWESAGVCTGPLFMVPGPPCRSQRYCTGRPLRQTCTCKSLLHPRSNPTLTRALGIDQIFFAQSLNVPSVILEHCMPIRRVQPMESTANATPISILPLSWELCTWGQSIVGAIIANSASTMVGAISLTFASPADLRSVTVCHTLPTSLSALLVKRVHVVCVRA